MFALERHELDEQSEHGKDGAEADDEQDGDAALALDARFALDALDLGPRHLDADEQEIEPAAGVPAGEDARDHVLDRRQQADSQADAERDEETDLRSGVPDDVSP